MRIRVTAEGTDHAFHAAYRYVRETWRAKGHDDIPPQNFAAEALKGITESVLGCLRWEVDMANGWKPKARDGEEA